MNTIEDLLEAFARFRQALLTNDTAALDQLVADDYCGSDPNGATHDRAMLFEAYGPDGVQLDTYEATEVSTRVLSDVGLVMGVGTLSGRYGEIHFEHRLRFLDVYVYRDANWQLSVSQVTEITTGE